MPDDPLYGDRPKPPFIPMNNDEIIQLDVARELDRASPRKRLIVIGTVVAGFALIGLLTVLYAGRSTSVPRSHIARADTPAQALTYLCGQFRSAETTFTGGGTEAVFEQRMQTITNTQLAFESASISRFETDLAAVDAQLATYDSVTGASLNDMHELCADAR